MWTISLPLKVPVSKKEDFYLNLNQYRNANHFLLNKAKIEFHERAKSLIVSSGIPKLEKLTLEYTLYPRTRQLCDVNNICTIVDKFFSDSLVKCGILEDDNYNFIADSRFKFGYIDRDHPRVDVVIRSPDHPCVPAEPIKESDYPTMKIQTTILLTKEDVSAAIRAFLMANGVTVADGALLPQAVGDGYEIRVEQGDAAPAKHKKQKLDPVAAMQELKERQAAQPPVKPPDAKLTDKAPEKPADLPFEPTKPTETPPAQVTIFTPAAAPAVEQPKAEEPAAPAAAAEPAAPKAPSLFSNFKRPSNG